MNFSEGLACVRVGDPKNGKWKYIDKSGKIVIDKDFDFPSDFRNDLAYVRIGSFKTGTIAYVDKKGAFVWQLKK
jgi:hypothetical protein